MHRKCAALAALILLLFLMNGCGVVKRTPVAPEPAPVPTWTMEGGDASGLDFVLAAPRAVWSEMVESIVKNKGADADHTLNTLSHIGDVINLLTATTRTGTTSVRVSVRVEAERYVSSDVTLVTEACLTMVAVNAAGQPIPFNSRPSVGPASSAGTLS